MSAHPITISLDYLSNVPKLEYLFNSPVLEHSLDVPNRALFTYPTVFNERLAALFGHLHSQGSELLPFKLWLYSQKATFGEHTDVCMELDIGCSNLKRAMCQREGEVKTQVIPVGAAPLELMAQQLMGGTSVSLQVTVERECWVAGVEPERLQGWERELHSDYASTKPYQALFLCCTLTR